MHDTFTRLIHVVWCFSWYSTVRHQKGIVTTLLTQQSSFLFQVNYCQSRWCQKH